MIHIPEEKLRSIILDNNLIEEKKLDTIIDECHRLKTLVTDQLIGGGLIKEQYLMEALAEYLGVNLFSAVDVTKMKRPIFTQIPEGMARDRGVFIVDKIDNEKMTVAMLDPNDWMTVNFLEGKFGIPVERILVSPSDFAALINLYKQSIGEEFQKIIAENAERVKKVAGKAELLARELPVINIFDTILDYGVGNRASDIHIEPSVSSVIIRYRIDGLLHDAAELPVEIHPAIVARVKILSALQIDEHRVPQDGRFYFKIKEEEFSVRVNVIPTLHGEKIAMRLLPSSHRPLNFADLGILRHNLELINKSILKTAGLILITGPTGSGKTTTLYTVLNLLNKPEVNIMTAEDPIEYEIPRISQVQINPRAGMNFADALRSFLRQNPDIIMVGEIRDTETTELAIHAALTGHLVFSTLHTEDSPSTIPRLLDLGAEPFLLASTLQTIIAQRLVRRICRDCVESYTLGEETRELIADQIKKTNKYRAQNFIPPTSLYRGRGCKVCNFTGFKGQIGIYEVLDITPEISELILKHTSADVLKDAALKLGLVTLFEDGLEKSESGMTTIEEVLREVRM